MGVVEKFCLVDNKERWFPLSLYNKIKANSECRLNKSPMRNKNGEPEKERYCSYCVWQNVWQNHKSFYAFDNRKVKLSKVELVKSLHREVKHYSSHLYVGVVIIGRTVGLIAKTSWLMREANRELFANTKALLYWFKSNHLY